MRAGREDHATGAHVPERVPRGAAFVQGRVAVVVQAEGGRLVKDPDTVGGSAADPWFALDEHHPVATLRGRVRGSDAGGTAADHQGLDVRVPMDDRLGSRRIDRQQADPRTPSSNEPIQQFDHGGRHDRLEPRRGDLDERAWFLDSGREDTAGPAEDRGAAHHVDPTREQRARERVALEPRVLDTLEGEPDRSRAIDPVPALGEAPPAHAGASSPIRYFRS